MGGTADAVIVGGGPAGLTAAVGLALRGLTAAVVDPCEDHGRGSRGLLIHAGTLAVLERAGCVAPILEDAVRIRSMRVNSRTGRVSEIPFGSLPGPYGFAVSLHQARTESVLRRRAEQLGVRFVTAWAVGVEEQGSAAVVTLDTGGSLPGRFVVGADGMHSTVREAAGIAFPDTGSNSGDDENMVLADVVASGPVDRESLNVFPGVEILVLAPLPGGRLRVVANLRDGERASDVDAIQRIIDSRGPLPRAGSSGRIRADELEWASRFRFRHHLADTFRAGRMVLAGDAGHVHSPVGGQGMNLGIRDGWYLAAALATAVRAEADGVPGEAQAVLDAYAADRRATAVGVIAATNQMSRMLFTAAPSVPAVRPDPRAAALAAEQALGLSGVLDQGPG